MGLQDEQRKQLRYRGTEAVCWQRGADIVAWQFCGRVNFGSARLRVSCDTFEGLSTRGPTMGWHLVVIPVTSSGVLSLN